MAGIAERFPNLFLLLKVVLLLIVVLVTLVAMSLVLLIAYVVYLLVTGGDVSRAAEMALSGLMDNAIVSSSYMVIQNLALILIAVVFMGLIDHRRPVLKALGLGKDMRPLRGFFSGAALNFLFLLVVLLIILGTGFSSFQGTGFEAYGPSPVIVSLIAMAIGTLFVGLGEEAVFRGYMQQILTEKYGVAVALGVTSAIFALFHSLTPFAKLGPLYIVGVFSLSLLLGYLLVVTKSLYASVGFHCFQDFLALQIFSFTGERTLGASPVLMFSKPGEIYLAGFFLGSWDDLISIVVTIVILLGLYVYHRSKTGKKSA